MHLDPTIVFVIMIASALAVCAVALWKGEAPERWAASLIVVSMSLANILGTLLQVSEFAMLELVGDGLTAVGFLVLTMIYGRLWLGAAMLFQAAQFALHSFYLVTDRKHDQFHAVVNNLDFLGIMLSLIAGTAIAIFRRWNARKALAVSAA